MTSTVAAVTQNQSLAAIRNFIRASVSCITYARGLCSDTSFEQKAFLGLELKHMVPSSTESITISEWIEKGAFDALNKNYLKEMSLCVYNATCSELLESYCFGFTYNEDGSRARMTLNASQNPNDTAPSQRQTFQTGYRKRRCSKAEIQRMLTDIITKLIEVVESLPPLLSERVLTMRLTYYDDVTPDDYEPPCFAPASERMVRMYQDEQKYNVSIGSMDTSHHLFSVAIRHPVLAEVRAKILEEQQQQQHRGQTQTSSQYTAADASFVSENARQRQRPCDTRYSNGASQRPSNKTEKTVAARTNDRSTRTAAAHHSSRSELDETSAAGAGGAAERSNQPRPPAFSQLPPLEKLCAKAGPITAHETTFLVLVCFALSRSARGAGGRGRFTYTELEDYLRDSCALEISPATAVAAMDRLVQDGTLQLRRVLPGRPVADRSRDSGTAAALGESSRLSGGDDLNHQCEWVVTSEPPSSVLQSLLNLDDVVALLPHAQMTALHSLLSHSADAGFGRGGGSAPGRRGAAARGKRGRMSYAAGGGCADDKGAAAAEASRNCRRRTEAS